MAYIGKSPSGTGVRSRFFYTQSSAGATSISGNDDDNRTLTFSDAEYVDVYLNGSLLAKGDYTAASNTISGLAALASGDIVEVVVGRRFLVGGRPMAYGDARCKEEEDEQVVHDQRHRCEETKGADRRDGREGERRDERGD